MRVTSGKLRTKDAHDYFHGRFLPTLPLNCGVGEPKMVSWKGEAGIEVADGFSRIIGDPGNSHTQQRILCKRVSLRGTLLPTVGQPFGRQSNCLYGFLECQQFVRIAPKLTYV